MPFFLKAAGVLRFNSYWFKEFKKLLVQSKLVAAFRNYIYIYIHLDIKTLPGKPLGLTVFCRILQEVSSGYQQPLCVPEAFENSLMPALAAFRKIKRN
jgi:hypothetical protein